MKTFVSFVLAVIITATVIFGSAVIAGLWWRVFLDVAGL